jgi:hypothetical protein
MCSVQAYAAAAMVNFSECAKKEHLAPYLDLLFERLMTILNTGKRYAQEQAITTLATIADSSGDQFIRYYPSIMPLLLNVLTQATEKEFRMLRGKTMECATLIALAVGKPIFAVDAPAFIQILKLIQSSIVEADDPQASYLLSAWARVCKVLGSDFTPFLEDVIPPLLLTADLKPEFSIFNGNINLHI